MTLESSATSTAPSTPEKETARLKLAYLFSGGDSQAAKDVAEEVVESSGEGGADDGCQKSSAELRAENAQLRAQVAHLELAQQDAPPVSVLGIKSSNCGFCGAAAVRNRVHAESRKLCCERCWAHWEKCGFWGPTVHLSTSPPRLGSSGLPEYAPEDAFAISECVCAHDDLTLFHRLSTELPQGKEFSDWHGSRHLGIQFEGEGARHNSDSAPPALREMVMKLEKMFGIQASASRLNLYQNFENYKPLHRDRGRDSNNVPQVTVGVSLGATRELTLMHYETGVTVSVPQRNGDVFAFTPELNNALLHGVPRVSTTSTRAPEEEGPRLSLILWGSRVQVLQAREAKLAEQEARCESASLSGVAAPPPDASAPIAAGDP